MKRSQHELPMGADLFGELQLSEPNSKKSLCSYLPGLVFVGVAALAALWLSEHYGAPSIFIGLMIGLSLNFVNSDKRLSAGLDFSSQTLLRLGIVLIGTQITFYQIAALGLIPFVSLIGIMTVVILTALLTAKLLKQNIFFGLLAGGATAICGASAALAIWSIVGQRRVDQSRFTIVLIGTTLASAFAMTFYPLIAGTLGFDDRQAGYLVGASIHDVAQAIGGGYSFSDQAGEVATIVKLSRVALLAPVLILITISVKYADRSERDVAVTKFNWQQGVPWFVVGFIILVAANTFYPIPDQLSNIADKVARILLLLAVIAAAVKSNMAGLLSQGWRYFGPIIAATLMSFALSLLVANFL
ncbi:MAG: putative sulfate exporter family transporter [Sphingomonadales bacterium]|nr:putative sulfate exporter family transporter [Sphingomonadales bacterium]